MPEIPPGSAYIPPEQMWRAIQETHDAVLELRGLINPALVELRDDVKAEIGERQKLDAREQQHHDQHEREIKDLQKRAWSSSWVTVAATSVMTGALGGFVLWVLGNGHVS